jgi:hypothetical protein
MDFKTTIQIPESTHKISLSSSVLTAGSCFSDVVGNRLINSKLSGLVNPFGTLFSPLAIAKNLQTALQNTPPSAGLFLQNQEQFFHYDFHSSFSGNTQDDLNAKLQTTISIVNKSLQEVDFLILTLGSSFVYELLSAKEYVANCHKMPSGLFRKELLSVKHICQVLGQTITKLKQQNSHLKIILTVSPVRHTREGLAENSLSKSILRAACHYLTLDYEGVEYFPSYEIMLDDLRDYRFYKADMIHPSEVAEDYIFERFMEAYFSIDLRGFVKEWASIQKALAHRPVNPRTTAHQNFLKKLLTDIEKLQDKTDVSNELEIVKSQIMY